MRSKYLFILKFLKDLVFSIEYNNLDNFQNARILSVTHTNILVGTYV